MWKAANDWISFSFKVWFALLTAQILIFGMFLVGYAFCIVVLGLLGFL